MTWPGWIALIVLALAFVVMTGCWLAERRLTRDALDENDILRRILYGRREGK